MTLKAIAEIKVHPMFAPFMGRHAQRAADALNGYLDACPTIDEKLGALGVLAQVLLAHGDALQAMQLERQTAGNG
jgi:hypothetical protein